MDKQPAPAEQTAVLARIRASHARDAGEHKADAGPIGTLARLGAALGNRMLGRVIQAKVEVGEPDDAYEQEADRVADAVVQRATRSGTDTASAPSVTPWVQRKESSDEEEETVQAKHAPAAARDVRATGDAFAARLSSGSPGNMLSDAARKPLEEHLGRDFSSIRVHYDGESAGMARDIGALAFTHGTHIYFGSGQFSPETTSGQRLLAHEVTHTLQQNPSLPRARSSDANGAVGSAVHARAAPTGTVQRACAECGANKSGESEECPSCGRV